ncbi:hypothetical protein Droror1_Dr00000119 [Drosera rotundifolia]
MGVDTSTSTPLLELSKSEVSIVKCRIKGRYDLVKFIKLVQQAGLYVHLRIGPYVCAEWNFGGLPVWLKCIPGINFRTDNEPFKDDASLRFCLTNSEIDSFGLSSADSGILDEIGINVD